MGKRWSIVTMAAIASAGVLQACSDLSQRSVLITSGQEPLTGQIYALPRSILTFDAVLTIASQTETLALDHTFQTFADDRARFRVQWNESSFADDHFTLAVGTNGLLNSSKSTNKDQSPAIVEKIVETVKAAKIFYIKDFSKSASDTKTPNPFKLKVVIDPFDANSVSNAGRLLTNVANLNMSIKSLDGQDIKTVSPSAVHKIAAACEGSICFRPQRPILFSFSGDKPKIEHQFIETFPDPSAVIRLDIHRGTCITRVTDLTFSDGSLSKVDLEKPSEILGCLSIPLSIMKAIVEVPAGILTFKTTETKNQAAYLAAQTELLNAQAALLSAQTKQNP